MKTLFWYVIAAAGELAGCYAFWLWLRTGKGPSSLVWGVPALGLFAYALTKIEAAQAGRVYAAYAAVYLLGALVWMRAVEGAAPDRWDMIGSGICLLGAGVIIFAPR